MKPCDPSCLSVRSADREDSSRIAILCGQLGYPLADKTVRERLQRNSQDQARQIFVVKTADGLVIGWVEVILRSLLVLDSAAEIGGLVVDEAYRGNGAGRLLMERAEHWARQHGCQQVYLRSNIIREGAHRFHERIGCQLLSAEAESLSLALRHWRWRIRDVRPVD